MVPPVHNSVPDARVVVVDDDAAVRDALKFSLELENFQVETFESAEALLEAGWSHEPSCLVLDQRLKGLSGLELLAALRKKGSAAPALLMTTQPDARLVQIAAAAGVPIVEKPLMGDALSSMIRSLLSQRKN